MSAGEIAAIFQHAWQTTTRHLQILESAGLLSAERQGRMRIYRIEQKRLALVSEWLAHFQKRIRPGVGRRQHVQQKNSSHHQSEARSA